MLAHSPPSPTTWLVARGPCSPSRDSQNVLGSVDRGERNVAIDNIYRAFVRNLKQDATFLDSGSYDVTLHSLPAYLPSNLSLRWLYSRSEMRPLS